ncbi:hypothetical protein GE09DRAFT_974522 [Coniochaeta sp. 2T2.1]|nr:hypothetical protein GE09DRAFT_974522 [Coniochaeta sp. 2T2.1]
MRKPTLALATPSTANFPKDVLRDIPSAISATTPLSALSMFREPLPSAGLPSAGLPCQTPMSARIKHEEKTPITPPIAYMDFLKNISLASPPLSGKMPLNRTSTSTSASSDSTTNSAESSSSEQEKGEIDSAPSTATSEKTDVSCRCDDHEHAPKSTELEAVEKMKSPKPAIALAGRKTPMSPLATGPQYPLSAPATNLNFPSLNLPASPMSNCGGVNSPKSPWSARSIRSPFDWDAALKSRRFTEVPGSAAAATASASGATATTPKTANAAVTGSKRESKSTVRHIREVVTRTVTYTPRMAPAPKGKRRKLDHETAVDA